MNSFVLSSKSVPNLRTFHEAIKLVVPELDGLLQDGSEITVVLTVEVTQELIDIIEGITPPANNIPDVSPRQIRQALILAGVSLQQIEDALDSLPEPTKSLARVEWEYSNAFERNRPLVNQVGTMLGWTSEQLDNLWITAANLP